VGDLICRKTDPQEILVLVCSRLDALACSAVREDEPREKLPPDIHLLAFGDEMFDMIHLLHEDLLPEGRPVTLKIPTRKGK